MHVALGGFSFGGGASSAAAATSAAAPSLFGAPASAAISSAATGGGLFGAAPAASAAPATGTGLFGAGPAASAPASAPLFGAAPAASAAPSLFAAPAASAPASAGVQLSSQCHRVQVQGPAFGTCRTRRCSPDSSGHDPPMCCIKCATVRDRIWRSRLVIKVVTRCRPLSFMSCGGTTPSKCLP